MTPARREALNARLHLTLAALAVWLVATSPWVSLLRRVPAGAGFFDYAHVAFGWLACVLAAVYGVTVSQGGRWQWFFPVTATQQRAIARDLAGIARGKVPSADGPGLYGAIKGCLLLALFATALTGAGWSLAQGSDLALSLRSCHLLAVQALLVTGAAHVLAVASHLIELVRN
jgi:CubicO group peptidase (beta-lactamase class C family)